MTPTSALGSERRLKPAQQRGFTLLELMVVMAIVAVGAALVTAALPDSVQSKLEEEGTRLSALLEAARLQSRASGQAVYWQPGPPGEEAAFKFVGLPASSTLPSQPLAQGMTAEVTGAAAIVLGPEPILPAQRVVLRLENQRLVVASDGLSAFEVSESGKP
jgi:general secretion pathway protein H